MGKAIKGLIIVLVVLGAMGACSAVVASVTTSATKELSGAIEQGTQTADVESAIEAPADDKASTCDQAREAFLTGTQAEVKRALKRLKADRTADGTAREYAGYWLDRDAGDSSMQEMDQSLIAALCS